MWTKVLTCLILAVVPVAAVEETVNTTSGFVMGTQIQGRNIVKFLGIPYAEPPVGERRFKRPEKKTRMPGTFNATSYGFACPQISPPLPESFAFLSVNFPLNEDCLNLNIFAPVTATKAFPLPVMLWVYGGGYATGAANRYDATLLADYNDVIVVVINYRLGILGFLNTMDENAVGNFGLRDQCLALKWVNDNIAEFGGNTSSITIVGESAGAASVTQLTMAPKCQGFFHRVIAQSGSAIAAWSHNPDPLKSAKELGSNMGCSTNSTSSLVQCLRSKSVDDLLKQQLVPVDFPATSPWIPSYVSDFFTPVAHKRIYDLLTGVNWEEGDAFYEIKLAALRAKGEINDKADGLPDAFVNETFSKVARAVFTGDPSQADMLLPSLRYEYTDWKDPHNKFSNNKMMVHLIGDITIHVSSIQFARMHSKGDHSDTGRTYFYRLKPRGSWLKTNPWTVGASHGEDVYFLFGALFTGFFNSTAEEKYLSHVMMEYWTNFAKTGNPNEPSKRYLSTQWPLYDQDNEEYIELDVNMTRDSIHKHPYAKRVAFWDSFIPEQINVFKNGTGGKSCMITTTPKEVVPVLPAIIG